LKSRGRAKPFEDDPVLKSNSYVEEKSMDRAFRDKGMMHSLGILDMELTERCNNNCIHCNINLAADDEDAVKRELGTDESKAILEEAATLGFLTVRFTGGEPLLREDFEDVYHFARKLGLKVLLATNATLITPGLARLLSRVPPLEKVGISLYGMTRGPYEAVTRSPGSFEPALQGIGLLKEHKVPFVVRGVYLPPNKGDVEKMETWASTIQWMDMPPQITVLLDLRCRRDAPKKNCMIEGLRPSPDEVLRFYGRKGGKYLQEMKTFCSKYLGPQGETLFCCGSGKEDVCVDAYGFFQPCMMLRHPDTVYDLGKGSLKKGMTDFFPAIRETRAKNPAYLERCARCFLMGLCEQCPARSWMEHGNLDTPVEYFCEIAHAQARSFGLLKEGEMGWGVSDWRERIRKIDPGKV
jgi:radical SAM protein with 4Fe4S-binding SPASM domain